MEISLAIFFPIAALSVAVFVAVWRRVVSAAAFRCKKFPSVVAVSWFLSLLQI